MERMIALLMVLLAALALAACAPEALEPGEPETTAEPGQPPTAETPTPPATARPSATPRPTEPTATGEPAAEEATRPRVEAEITPVVEELQPLPTMPAPQTPVTGEAPSGLVAEMKKDLNARTGIPVEEITVEYAEDVVWRDGSLGCPQPGMMYTMALVPGYRVILAAGGKQYDYHASERGGFVLCEGGGLKSEPGPGTGLDVQSED
jgi:hypothetical protein